MRLLKALLVVCAMPAAGLFLIPRTPTLVTQARRAGALQLSTEEAPLADNTKVEAVSQPGNWPVLAAAAGTTLVTLVHAPAFANFASQWQSIAAAGVTGDALTAPFSFWAFFALMHPLLKPAIAIGEVLHGSPGPVLGDVMPVSFILLNVAVLGATMVSSQLRSALLVGTLGLLINFVGCGLEGRYDLAEFNMAMDDGVRGCPTYEQVRQPSMAGFDVTKYTGRWYEHAFHDYTQFSDVYDTTLDIELSADGTRWLDDFALKGPSPTAAPRSWDKSPVANGAHYFLYGKIDAATPGVLQESGFGVTFPNFIVDVQKDEAGEYSEAIQFQCLERGGVRIFEGINFLSRAPTMSAEQMAAMHARATAAGMDPYGSAPEQMHVVPHTPVDMAPIDNSWQVLWRNLHLPELLALVETSTHSAFEDTSAIVK